jgi:hypothetical protein
MNQSPIEPALAADRHDAVLALALGALSYAQRFEELVAAAAAPAAAPLDLDDDAVLAALGLISLGRSLRRWLEDAAEPSLAPGPKVSCAGRLTLRELTR